MSVKAFCLFIFFRGKDDCNDRQVKRKSEEKETSKYFCLIP